jgi:Cytochrome C'
MRALSLSIFLAFALTACGQQGGVKAPAAVATDAAQPHSTLLQLMRGLLYPNSEIIFAAQSEDPVAVAEAAKAKAAPGEEKLYQGWESVENASLMLSEAAALIMSPGRMCDNGLPAPVGNADYQKAAKQLIAAGQAAYEAAKKKDMDAIVDAGGVVSDACSACHDVYRDKSGGQMRCVTH